WLASGATIVVAVLGAGTVAVLARRVHEHRLAVALSGLAGPGIVVAGYAAGSGGDLRLSHAVAVLAAAAGLLTSVAIAVPRSRRKAMPIPTPVAPPHQPAAIEAAPAP